MLEPVIARKTGMQLELLTAWKEIAGEEFANTTRPEKINWPRRSNEDDPFEPATLIVACEPSAALFFQHEMAPVLERINLFFGFQAVKRIKIVQKSVAKLPDVAVAPARELTEAEERELAKKIAEVENPKLQETLSKLGRGVMTKKSDI